MRTALLSMLVTVAAVGSACTISPGQPPTTSVPTPPGWEQVEQTVWNHLGPSAVTGLGLAVHEADGSTPYEQMFGTWSADRNTAVASASKLVSAEVLLVLVTEGLLSLDSTTGDVLGWTGPNSTITLRHLLSFTSGLAPSALCSSLPGTTLEACVDQIAVAVALAPPGTRYDYGNAHLQVAGRMAEVVTGMSWNDVFRHRLADPLGLPADVSFYTLPRTSQGTTNPLIAGGLRASMDDYASFLELLIDGGLWGGDQLITSSLIDDLRSQPFPGVFVGSVPPAAAGYDFGYGFGTWLECPSPASVCPVITSPGAFGFTPWIDWTTGYFAIIGMELGFQVDGVPEFSVGLEQALQPQIESALQP